LVDFSLTGGQKCDCSEITGVRQGLGRNLGREPRGGSEWVWEWEEASGRPQRDPCLSQWQALPPGYKYRAINTGGLATETGSDCGRRPAGRQARAGRGSHILIIIDYYDKTAQP